MWILPRALETSQEHCTWDNWGQRSPEVLRQLRVQMQERSQNCASCSEVEWRGEPLPRSSSWEEGRSSSKEMNKFEELN